VARRLQKSHARSSGFENEALIGLIASHFADFLLSEGVFRRRKALAVTKTSRSFAIPHMFGSREMSLTLRGAHYSHVET
jgi:hypothetical protein